MPRPDRAKGNAPTAATGEALVLTQSPQGKESVMNATATVSANQTGLIPVFMGKIGERETPVCDGRDLHGFIQVGTKFEDWMPRRIREYGFVEGEDYLSILRNRSDGKAGKPRTDYHLSIDMGKELAMVERNDKGRQVRRYFIECERRIIAAHQFAPLPLPSDSITPAEQNVLQQIVARRSGESGGIRAYMWSRFNNHFALGSYKQLPRVRFDEARAYLEGMPMKSSIAVVPAPTFQEHIARCMDMAVSVTDKARREIFDSLVKTGAGESQITRYMVCLDHEMKPSVYVVEPGAVVASLPRLAEMILESGALCPKDEDLALLAQACTQRLAARYQNRTAIAARK